MKVILTLLVIGGVGYGAWYFSPSQTRKREQAVEMQRLQSTIDTLGDMIQTTESIIQTKQQLSDLED